MSGADKEISTGGFLGGLTQVISIILHPLFMPLYATWLLFNTGSYLSYSTTPALQRFIYIVIFVSTYMLPAISAWLMTQRGWLTSLEMSNRKERLLPFLITLICYIAGIYLLFRLPIPRVFGIMVGGAAAAIFAALLITIRWKISIHMIGIGGLMGLMYAFARFFHVRMIPVLIVLALLSGILGAIRAYRGAHSPAQIYSGFLIGFALEYAYLWFFVNRILNTG